MDTLPVVPEELKQFDVIFDQDVVINYVYDGKNSDEDGEQLEQKTLKCRILTTKNSEDEVVLVKVEFTTDSNIDFVRESNISIDDFATIKEEFNLLIDFLGFIDILCEFFDKSTSDPQNIRIYLYDPDSEMPKLTFMQTLRLCIVEVFSIHLQEPYEDYRLRLAQCRFNAIKAELNNQTDKLEKAFKKLDAKSPSMYRLVREKVQRVK